MSRFESASRVAASEISEWFGGEEWNQKLLMTRNDEFRKWEETRIAEMLTRIFAPLVATEIGGIRTSLK